MSLKQATFQQIDALRNRNGAVVGWVLAPQIQGPYLGLPPSAVIERIAQVIIVHPPSGHGERPLHVGVVDFLNKDADGSPARFINSANGYGYDKLAAAMSGMSVGGITLGDHCDPSGAPLLETLCNKMGWTWIRGY